MIKTIAKLPGLLLLLSLIFLRKIWVIIYRPLFKYHGKNFVFDPNDSFSYNTISVGDDVFIGKGACFAASETYILIGNKVMFGPNVTIMGGDHNTTLIGKYMYDVKNKQPENDLPVIIHDDVWIGTGVIILKGVTIGRGSIVAAGALVTRSCQPYSIIGGIPAKLIKMRFSSDEIKMHEELLKH